MEGKTIGIIAIVIVLIGGGWYLLSSNPASTSPTADQSQTPVTDTTTTTTTSTTTTTTAPANVTVVYTSQGFSPKSVSVKLGTTVTFVNQSTGGMWVASAAHPSHTVYSGTSLSQHCPDTANTAFDECVAVTSGGSYSFTFNKVGDWKYHNHVNAADFGSVTVTTP